MKNSTILPNSSITLDAVTVVAVTSFTSASAVAKVTSPSNCPAVASAPRHKEISISFAKCMYAFSTTSLNFSNQARYFCSTVPLIVVSQPGLRVISGHRFKLS